MTVEGQADLILFFLSCMQNSVACCRMFAVHLTCGLAHVQSASFDAKAAKSRRCTVRKSGCRQTENGWLDPPQRIITSVLAQRGSSRHAATRQEQ